MSAIPTEYAGSPAPAGRPSTIVVIAAGLNDPVAEVTTASEELHAPDVQTLDQRTSLSDEPKVFPKHPAVQIFRILPSRGAETAARRAPRSTAFTALFH